MIEVVCDCGAVRLDVAEAPEELNDCPCVWCQRLGALWAYYPRSQVQILSEPDATSIYLRAAHRLEFHRCKTCGLTTHWVNREPTQQWMGVNARLMPRDVRDRARVVQGG
jgi:hypothetical protein